MSRESGRDGFESRDEIKKCKNGNDGEGYFISSGPGLISSMIKNFPWRNYIILNIINGLLTL
jgi:hypothetical protein